MAVLRRFALAALALCAAAAALAGWGCFSPNQPGCAFSCVTDGRCPAAYHCADDGLCHRDDGQGTCDLLPVTDAGADGGDDAAGDAQDGATGN
jgi:hypothetical protein